MTDIEMLETIYDCVYGELKCRNCKIRNFGCGCVRKKREWLAEYIQKLKNREDDLK